MNLWRQFDTLIAMGGPLFIGEVLSIQSGFGDQRCTVALLPSGATLTGVIAAGYDLAIGQRFVIQNGRIKEAAPDGTVLTADI